EALPYAHKALELIKSLQQKSRVYVEKTGFKPPTLKPAEKRLSGELAEIINPQQIIQEEALVKAFPHLRKAVVVLEKLQQPFENNLEAIDKEALQQAGNELAGIILKQPGINVSVLNDLRQLIDDKNLPVTKLYHLEQQLVKLLPVANRQPGSIAEGSEPELDIFVQKLGR
ncbi:MAG: hypothetical protein H7Y04_11170, partial [Verrucomicrobia bacterium]|nr:hypothetical protein [Cytophagales bacterium]